MNLSLLKSFLPEFFLSFWLNIVSLSVNETCYSSLDDFLCFHDQVIFFTIAFLFLLIWCFFFFINNKSKIKNFFTRFTIIEIFLCFFFSLIFGIFIKINFCFLVNPALCDDFPTEECINSSILEESQSRISIEHKKVLIHKFSYLKNKENIVNFDRFIFILSHTVNGVATDNDIFYIPAGEEAYNSLQLQHQIKYKDLLSNSILIRFGLISNKQGYDQFSFLFQKHGLLPPNFVCTTEIEGSNSIRYNGLFLTYYPIKFMRPIEVFGWSPETNLYDLNTFIQEKFRLMKEYEYNFQVRLELDVNLSGAQKEHFLEMSKNRVKQYNNLQKLTLSNKVIPKIDLKSIENTIERTLSGDQPACKKPRTG